MSFEVRQ